MSNLKAIFNSRLTGVVKTVAKNGKKNVYTASFEDGTSAVIRTSPNDYVAVAQVEVRQRGHWEHGAWVIDPSSDFLFSRKPNPAIASYQQHIVTVQISDEEPDYNDGFGPDRGYLDR